MKSAPLIAHLKDRIGRLSANRLLRAGFWLTLANVIVGLMGYAYQVLMGRMLSPGDFALFSAIMALFMFFSSPLGAMFMVISRRVSSLRAHNRLADLRILYRRTHEYLILFSILLFLLLIPLAGKVQVYLKSTSVTPVWFFGVFLVIGAFLLVNNAFFQGMQRFGGLAGTNVLSSLLKIVFSVLLVIQGFGVSGAISGAVIACAGTWLIGLWLIIPRLPHEPKMVTTIARFPMRTVFPVLVANIAFAAMTQLDMVLVNWYFPPEQAGLYAAASVLGKAVLYLPGGLVMALYPMVAENHAKEQGSAHIMLQAVAVTATLCGVTALIYWVTGDWLITMFYGQSYAGAGELLRWYGFAILPMALVMVAEYFLIAKGRVLFAWLFLGMAPLQVLAIHLWHDHLWMVVAIMGSCGCILVAIGYGMLWRDYRRVSNFVPSSRGNV